MATSRMYGQRLARDVAELYNHDFRCNSSNVIVRPFGDSSSTPQPNLNVTLANGPFRSGQFQFEMLVPTNYPFKSVEVRASHPIWHPNIDLQTGKLSLPQEWSPVLNLVSLTVSVQMIMLEPSAETPLNVEALSYYLSNTELFDATTQKTLQGNCSISGINFPVVIMSAKTCKEAKDFYGGNMQRASVGRISSVANDCDSWNLRQSEPFVGITAGNDSYYNYSANTHSSFYLNNSKSRSCSQLNEQGMKIKQDENRRRKRPFHFDDDEDDDDEDDDTEDTLRQMGDSLKNDGQMDLVDDEYQHQISNACSQLTLKSMATDVHGLYSSLSAPATPAAGFDSAANMFGGAGVGASHFHATGSSSENNISAIRNSAIPSPCPQSMRSSPFRKVKKLN